AVVSNGNIYVVDSNNHRIQYFTSSGSFLGKWGSEGTGNGQFSYPRGIAVTPDGAYFYVADCSNHRIQYFVDDQQFAVAPSSLGRIKTLFR
nr:6-bladed beta-propeller [candidate division Zixibacteria bacterium]